MGVLFFVLLCDRAGDSLENRGSYDGREGERVQKYLTILGLFEVYRVRTAERVL